MKRLPISPSPWRLAAVLLLGLLAPSCIISKGTVNEPLEEARTDLLVPGVTTAAEVAQILGAPNEVVQLGLRSAWRYDFTKTKEARLILIVVTFDNTDTRQDRIWVFFDEDDVLSNYSTTNEAGNVRYAMPWQKVKTSDGTSEETTDEAEPEEEG